MTHHRGRWIAVLLGLASLLSAGGASAQQRGPDMRPRLDKALTPDARAHHPLAAMTPDEKIGPLPAPLGMPLPRPPKPEGALGSAGYLPGIARLGIPALQETDAGLGVANPSDVRPGDQATPLPSGLAIASTFDPELAARGGQMIGAEARAKGFNV